MSRRPPVLDASLGVEIPSDTVALIVVRRDPDGSLRVQRAHPAELKLSDAIRVLALLTEEMVEALDAAAAEEDDDAGSLN